MVRKKQEVCINETTVILNLRENRCQERINSHLSCSLSNSTLQRSFALGILRKGRGAGRGITINSAYQQEKIMNTRVKAGLPMLCKWWMPLVIVALVAFVSGCYSSGRKIDQSNIERIQIGKTTKQEVTSLLGAPDQLIRRGNGEVLMRYSYHRMQIHASSFIPIVGLFAGGADTQNQGVTVTVGSDGVVRDIMSSEGGMDINNGLKAGETANLPEGEENKLPK